MKKRQNNKSSGQATPKAMSICTIVLAIVLAPSLVAANPQQDIAGVIDEPSLGVMNEKDTKKQVKKEQQALEKENRSSLQNRADKGERLAQVVLGADFAAEAQLLTFAPVAANDALSDALQWYALAAKRGFPGALSLDKSGVSFYPVRTVRNR